MAGNKFTIFVEELERIIAARMATSSEVKISEIVSEIQSKSKANPNVSEAAKTDVEISKVDDSGKTFESDPIEESSDVANIVAKSDDKTGDIDMVPVEETLDGGSDSVVRPSLTSGGGLDVLVTPGGGNVTEEGLETEVADVKGKSPLVVDEEVVGSEEKTQQNGCIDRMIEGGEEDEQEVQSAQPVGVEYSKVREALDSLADLVGNEPDTTLSLAVPTGDQQMDDAVNTPKKSVNTPDEEESQLQPTKAMSKKRKAQTPAGSSRRNLRSAAKFKVAAQKVKNENEEIEIVNEVNEVSVMLPLNKDVLLKMFFKFRQGEGWVRRQETIAQQETVKVEEEAPKEPEAEQVQNISLEMFEQLKSDLKNDLVANRMEMTQMKNAFKRLNDSLGLMGKTLSDHSEEYESVAKAVKKIAGYIKGEFSIGSSSGKGTKH